MVLEATPTSRFRRSVCALRGSGRVLLTGLGSAERHTHSSAGCYMHGAARPPIAAVPSCGWGNATYVHIPRGRLKLLVSHLPHIATCGHNPAWLVLKSVQSAQTQIRPRSGVGIELVDLDRPGICKNLRLPYYETRAQWESLKTHQCA